MKTEPNTKRVMTPAIAGMTVKQERSCLAEIRNLEPDVTHDTILSNGWTAGKFALAYITGHHIKRKTKSNKASFCIEEDDVENSS